MFYSNPESAYDNTWAASDAYFREQKILCKIDALRRYLQTLEERTKSLKGTDAKLTSRIEGIKAEIATLHARLDADEPHTAALTPSPPASKTEATIPQAHKKRKTPTRRTLLALKSEKPPRRVHNGLAASCRRNNPSPQNSVPEHIPMPSNDLAATPPKSYATTSPPHIPQNQRRRHNLAPPPRSDQI